MATLYGDFVGSISASVEGYPISYSGAGLFNLSPLAADLMDLLPSYYLLGNNVRRIMELIAVVLDEYHDRIDEVRDQFFVNTATWGLHFWEALVGLPVSENLSDEERRVLIINKLRNCSSEKCFVEGLEAIVNGMVIVTLLDPATNPYQIDIELRSADVVYPGPKTAPVPLAFGSGLLDGEYTYKVTYGFPPIIIPDYIDVTPDGLAETNSGVSPIRTNEKQAIAVLGSVTGGTFTVTYDNMWDSTIRTNEEQSVYVPNTGAGTFTIEFDGETTVPLAHTSTGVDVVNAINALSPSPTYGPFAVSTTTPAVLVSAVGGVTIVFDTAGVQYQDVPNLAVTNITGLVGAGTVIQEVMGSEQTSQATNPYTTPPLPWNATRAQVNDALLALPTIFPGTIRVTGGPLPSFPITVEFIGYESGFPQSMLSINDVLLTGGGSYYGTRLQNGGTTYGDSESATIMASGQQIELTNVPISPEGASTRNIYRKRIDLVPPLFHTVDVGSPYNEYRYVGSIDDNTTPIFVDNIPDEDLSEVQFINFNQSSVLNASYYLKFDGQVTGQIDALGGYSDAAAVKTELDALSLGYSIITTVSGSYDTGFTVAFSGGDVVGCDVPMMEVIPVITGSTPDWEVTMIGPRVLTEKNTAFTYTFQRALDYIYVTKPAHLKLRMLRSAAFRASINSAGQPV